MYKLIDNPFSSQDRYVMNLTTKACIPFDPANTDYQKFKTDVLAREELQDADGNVMTQEEADAFIDSLA